MNVGSVRMKLIIKGVQEIWRFRVYPNSIAIVYDIVVINFFYKIVEPVLGSNPSDIIFLIHSSP